MSSGDDRDYNGIKINDYNAVKISLANPKTIRENSKGEVKKPETVNYRTFRPERDGLFCERIFGPERDWECSCGKYRGMKYKGMTCDRCGVKITRCNVRRSRMGHIELAAPVVHIWFFKAASSKLANLLDMKTSDLEKVIYFQDYVVIDPGEAPVKTGDVINESKYREFREEFRDSGFKAEMGAEAVRKLLNRLNLVEESRKLREEIKTVRSKQARKDYITRLRLIDALKNCRNENNPAWMVLDVIPVIPPDLRPLVLLETQTFATSDLNDLYRRIINRNNRLKKLVDMNAPEVIVRNEKRMLQQAVDALFDNARCKRATQGANNRPLKSLTDMIKGKQGRFRENLLGKRVDYSARSVIVVGPTMRLYQCGLPKKIALELFQPFIIRCLKERGHADTIKSAKKMLERKDEEVWDILEEVIKNHPVLLNRAPTLHRMGIQAFEPMLVEGNAIKLHPLACKGFNADFDGDQMAVHLPLSLEAQVEAHTLMLSTNNIFSPANGKPIISPSQDIVMGCYYMTQMFQGLRGEGMTFASKEELLLAYAHKKVALQARIKVRMEKNRWQKDDDSTTRETTSVPPGKLFETTVGRVLFNEIIPCDGTREMPFYNKLMRSKELQKVISDCHEICGRRETVDLLDRMMRLGFEESTHSGLSFAMSDLVIPEEKTEILAQGEREVQSLQESADEGLISELERYNKTIDIWTRVNTEVTDLMMEKLKAYVGPDEQRRKGINVSYEYRVRLNEMLPVLLKGRWHKDVLQENIVKTYMAGTPYRIRFAPSLDENFEANEIRHITKSCRLDEDDAKKAYNFWKEHYKFYSGLHILDYAGGKKSRGNNDLEDLKRALAVVIPPKKNKDCISIVEAYKAGITDRIREDTNGDRKGLDDEYKNELAEHLMREGDSEIFDEQSAKKAVDFWCEQILRFVQYDVFFKCSVGFKGYEKPNWREKLLKVLSMGFYKPLHEFKQVDYEVEGGASDADFNEARKCNEDFVETVEKLLQEIRKKYNVEDYTLDFERDIAIYHKYVKLAKIHEKWKMTPSGTSTKLPSSTKDLIPSLESLIESSLYSCIMLSSSDIAGLVEAGVFDDLIRFDVLNKADKTSEDIVKDITDKTNLTEDEAREIFELLKTKREGIESPLAMYDNPIQLMSDSGARGGREQIRQLSGMRGLMAKPNGDIIETPVKANFKEGLNVLEYFSSTHGARKGLSDTALKTADSGYLTRKLVDVAQNCVVTMHDCGTKKSVIKGAVYKDDKIEVPLSEAILGRVSCENIVSLITDEVIVHKDEVITAEIARKIEDTLGENARIRVRSPMTCEAELGVCALCYGMDLSTSKLVEEGLAVGTIAAQSIGEPGTQLTMRTFHQGGAAGHSAKDIELTTKHEGYVKFKRMEVEEVRPNEPGSKKGARGKKAKAEEDSAAGSLVCVACKPDGGIAICKDKDLHWEIEVYNIPEGAVIDVREGDKVQKDDKLCMIDPHNKLILAKLDGRVHFINIVDGDTVQVTTDETSGKVTRTVTEARGERHPHIAVQDKKGKILEDHYLPGKTQIEVNDGDLVRRGEVLARTPLSGAGNQDITSGLPRVTEIFEARKPKDPAVLAEIDGVVDIGEEKHRKVLVTVRNEKTGKEKVHEVPIGKHNLIVHTGDDIQAGQPLTDGQRVPNEILHISGEEAIQNYLIEEVQKVYRGQGVSINDKHIEVIISQMLRRVKVKDPGDTSLLEGDLVDKFIFRRHNRRLEKCVKVTEQGGTDFQVGEIVPKEVFDEKNAEAQAGGAEPAKAAPPAPAVAETQLLGIAKAAVQSESFISAASFQETTKVLSDAAVAYRIDNLVGLKENVILGRLIPAGTGFRKYQDAEWRYRPEAVENQPVPDLGQSVEMPLLSPDPTEEGAPEDLGVDFMPSFDDVQDEINPEEGDA